jgi:hypothetical protein
MVAGDKPQTYMERIQVTVDEVVSGDSDDAFDMMLRFERFAEWWPLALPVRCVASKENFVGNKALISPYPFVKVGWELHSYSPGREIIIHYYQGMHTGVGVWTFSEMDDGRAFISFEIDILPKNRLFAWAYRLFDVRRSHIQHVRQVIAALAGQLSPQKPKPVLQPPSDAA